MRVVSQPLATLGCWLLNVGGGGCCFMVVFGVGVGVGDGLVVVDGAMLSLV